MERDPIFTRGVLLALAEMYLQGQDAAHPKASPLYARLYEDKDRQEETIWANALDWTIVRPAVLNDKPARGRIRALTDLSGVHGGTIARADVADFVVQQLTADTWLRKAPLITW